MQILGIIPARSGSKRVPRKNVRLLNGKPLVGWSIEACLASKALTRFVVSSDDEEVLSIAARYDAKLALRRPAEISGDRSLAIEFVRHGLKTLEGRGEGPYDGVAIIQPSSPLTTSIDIDAVVNLFSSSGAESAVSVMEVNHALHPLKLKTMLGDRLIPYLEAENGRMAAHELPRLYVRNCSVYVTRRDILDTGKILGDDCRGYLMPPERSIDINDELDWKFARFLTEQSERSGDVSNVGLDEGATRLPSR